MHRPQRIWQARRGSTLAECSIVRTCAGVDLQVKLDETPTTRERHPDSATAYERARALLEQYLGLGYLQLPP